jgi:hypothetical protein
MWPAMGFRHFPLHSILDRLNFLADFPKKQKEHYNSIMQIYPLFSLFARGCFSPLRSEWTPLEGFGGIVFTPVLGIVLGDNKKKAFWQAYK